MGTSPAPRQGRGRAASYRLRVSSYDRTASLILSLLLLVGLLVIGLLIVYVTMQLIERTVAVPISMADAASRPADAAMGLARDIEPPGIEEAPELAEPDLPETLSSLANAAAQSQAILADVTNESDSDASRGSGLGDSRGAGSGSEGERVPRWERWRIQFVDVASLTSYAAQLDYFGIELAVLAADGKVYYAFNLSSKPPETRVGTPEEENRIRFLWKDGPLRRSDAELLNRADLRYPGRPILQFIPREVEAILLQLEQKHAEGRDVDDIRRTLFAVKQTDDGYVFQVVEQRYF